MEDDQSTIYLETSDEKTKTPTQSQNLLTDVQ